MLNIPSEIRENRMIDLLKTKGGIQLWSVKQKE
jgi:hypothetical protein